MKCPVCNKEIKSFDWFKIDAMMGSKKYINTLEMSWNDFEKYVTELAKQIKHSKLKVSNIYGIPRGGLIVAVRLSHLLGKPLTTSWKDCDNNTLIVDDVCDTGKTLSNHQPYCYAYPRYKGLIKINSKNLWNIATLLYCPNSCIKPTFFSGLKSKTTWVVFPWEKK